MENRQGVLADYFKLRLLLNRTNLVRNQKTEVIFVGLGSELVGYRLVASLKGIPNPKHLDLCIQNNLGDWRPATYSGLSDLEEFCVTFLKENLGYRFSSEIFNKTIKALTHELQSLGISR